MFFFSPSFSKSFPPGKPVHPFSRTVFMLSPFIVLGRIWYNKNTESQIKNDKETIMNYNMENNNMAIKKQAVLDKLDKFYPFPHM